MRITNFAKSMTWYEFWKIIFYYQGIPGSMFNFLRQEGKMIMKSIPFLVIVFVGFSTQVRPLICDLKAYRVLRIQFQCENLCPPKTF